MVDINKTRSNIEAKKPKNIIYVDASSLRGQYKIGLYDKTNKVKHTLELDQSIQCISKAELCAVLYGLMYIHKCNNQNRHVLMNDCEAAISNKKLIEVGQILNTKILWIPREINKADKVVKSKINKKKKVLRDLNFFMKLVFGKSILLNAKKKIPEHAMINPLSSLTTIMLEEVLSQKELFPVSTKDFTPLVMKVASNNDIALKKGDIQKIRKELCDTNYIVMKNKMISLI